MQTEIKTVCLNPHGANVSKRNYRHEVFLDGIWFKDFDDKEDAREYIHETLRGL